MRERYQVLADMMLLSQSKLCVLLGGEGTRPLESIALGESESSICSSP